MTTSFIYDLDRVLPFVQSLLPGMPRSSDMVSIGLERDGELVAGVLYEGINAHNLMMHVAAIPGAHWMTRDYLRAAFAYPFLVCGVKRVTGYVVESNAVARRFDEHLGFKEEARLKGAAHDGSDLILYVMWRQDCRFLPGAKEC